MDMAEEGLQTLARGGVPEPDGGVQAAREHVARRERSGGIVDKGAAIQKSRILSVSRG